MNSTQLKKNFFGVVETMSIENDIKTELEKASVQIVDSLFSQLPKGDNLDVSAEIIKKILTSGQVAATRKREL